MNDFAEDRIGPRQSSQTAQTGISESTDSAGSPVVLSPIAAAGGVSAVFNWARGEHGSDGDYLAIDNPVTRTKPIKIEREDEDIDPFSPEEIPQVIKAAREGWERSVVIVALGTGLRPNENFGLKRTNVDLDAHVIRVRQTFSRFGEGGLKTSRSDVTLIFPNPFLKRSANTSLTGNRAARGYGQSVCCIRYRVIPNNSVRKPGPRFSNGRG